MLVRDDVPDSAIPRQRGRLHQRNDIHHEAIAGSSVWAVATEWLGRFAAVLAIFVVLQVLEAVHTGQQIQTSAAKIVDNMETTNEFFDDRADFTVPARARSQLEMLATVLAKLDRSAGSSVDLLASTLPSIRKILNNVDGNAGIAGKLLALGRELREAATSISATAEGADATVKTAGAELKKTIALLDDLNGELAQIERRLAPVPDLSGVLP
jgi:hypothetical protein